RLRGPGPLLRGRRPLDARARRLSYAEREWAVGPASSRRRTASVIARSATVIAIASAPSRTARSADSVTHAAVNSGWWLLAPLASTWIIGWIAGIRSETLAMSVEPPFLGGSSGNVRPSASALRRYSSPSSTSGRNSEYGG